MPTGKRIKYQLHEACLMALQRPSSVPVQQDTERYVPALAYCGIEACVQFLACQ